MNTTDNSAMLLRSVGSVSSAGYLRRVFLFETFGITSQLWTERAQDGDEVGVRVEIQRLEEQRGRSEFDAVELRLYDPVFRADLFSLSTNAPGNFDRAHVHERFDGRDPGPRVFEPALTEDPVAWLAGKLSDLDGILEAAGRPELLHSADSRRIADAVPAILAAVEDMLSLIAKP